MVLGVAALFVGPIILARKTKEKWFGVLLSALFSELFLVGVAISTYDAVNCTEEAVGTIEEIQESQGFRGSVRYKAVIRYEVDGQAYRETAKSHRIGKFAKRNYRVGDSVALLYDPASPDRVIVKSLRILQPLLYFSGAVLFSIPVIRGIRQKTCAV